MKNKMIKLLSLLKIIIQSLIFKNKIYIFGTPMHGNLGDQAIALAEEKFLKDNFKKYKAIKIESSIVKSRKQIIKKIIGNSLIMMHGGGFLGSLWIKEEQMFRTTIENFPNNKIIVFPQTIYFSNDKEGKKILEESKKIYNSHNNLHICCREEYSYKFMKKEFPKCNIMLVPDMVLYLNEYAQKYNRNNVLLCLRKDKEKIDNNLDIIIKKLNSYKLFYTDTVIKKKITEINRKKEFNKKLDEFSKYKLVITDRLHGMIFALLTGTPCIVFNNSNYKIKGVYKWIEKTNYIKFYNEKEIDKDLNNLINLNNNHYNNNDLKNEYQPLIKEIKNK